MTVLFNALCRLHVLPDDWLPARVWLAVIGCRLISQPNQAFACCKNMVRVLCLAWQESWIARPSDMLQFLRAVGKPAMWVVNPNATPQVCN
jgi:hypothetical protein